MLLEPFQTFRCSLIPPEDGVITGICPLSLKLEGSHWGPFHTMTTVVTHGVSPHVSGVEGGVRMVQVSMGSKHPRECMLLYQHRCLCWERDYVVYSSYPTHPTHTAHSECTPNPLKLVTHNQSSSRETTSVDTQKHRDNTGACLSTPISVQAM